MKRADDKSHLIFLFFPFVPSLFNVPPFFGRLFGSVDTDERRHAVRNRAIIYLAEYCGLRATEVCLLKMDDYDTLQSSIYCTRLKKGNDNTIRIIDPRVLAAINDYLNIRDTQYKESEYLFVSQKGTALSRKSLDKIMKYHCMRADIPASKQHFHVLRHTRAMAEYGFDTKDIQWWLGHKRIGTTTIYMKYTTRQQDSMYDKLALALKEE